MSWLRDWVDDGLARGLQRSMGAVNSYEPSAPSASTIQRGARLASDIRYGSTHPNSYLDVYIADDDPSVSRPTVLVVHGGGFIGGSKSDGDPNAESDEAASFAAGHGPVLAAGYNLVLIDYALAPQHPYPTPLRQLDEALAFLLAEGDRYGLDMDRLVLSGGSAGGQIVGQYVNLVTNPAYARRLGIAPVLVPSQVQAVLLDSTPFDPARASGTQAPSRRNNLLFAVSLRAYLRSPRDIADANIIDHATSDFPPVVIADGNVGTFPDQAQDFADRLSQLGVAHELILYARDEAELGHGFMAQASPWTDDYNRRKIAFLDAVTRPPRPGERQRVAGSGPWL